MTVGAAEARVAHAAEVAVRQADAAPPRAADIGGDVAHFRRVVARHRDRAAVDHCKVVQPIQRHRSYARLLSAGGLFWKKKKDHLGMVWFCSPL